MCLKFTECNPLHLIAIIGILTIEIILILTGNDGAYIVPIIASICLILGVKIPEDQAISKIKDILSVLIKK